MLVAAGRRLLVLYRLVPSDPANSGALGPRSPSGDRPSCDCLYALYLAGCGDDVSASAAVCALATAERTVE
jgi:hypothetical protein